MPTPLLRIGTRGSPLALAQAREVAGRLAAVHGLDPAAIETVVIRTSGDRIQDRPLAEAGGKGLFTKEIEEALTAGTIDLAVHSMKDMPTVLPAGLAIVAMLPREDVRDAFISPVAASIAGLPAGARIGTSSLRRAAQLQHIRPDLVIVPLRGNVETRLRKLEDGVAEATLLAVAGLNRLGLQHRITAPIEPDIVLPAVAQGAIGIEVRFEDAATRAMVEAIDDTPTSIAVGAERVFLARLEGSCRTPIAALAQPSRGGTSGPALAFRGEILSPDGRVRHVTARAGSAADAARFARDAADEVLAAAGPGFLAATGRA
jgi:hydroxymethylbilane synthase